MTRLRLPFWLLTEQKGVWWWAILLGACWAVAPLGAGAHGDAPVTPDTAWGAWNWEPTLLLSLILAAGLYALGVRRLWQRAGIGSGVRRWQVAAFGGGLGALVLALVSPLEAVAGALFSVHMVQHLLLILGAAPLLVLGAPLYVWLWALPVRWRSGLGRWWRGAAGLQSIWHVLSHPLAIWWIYGATMWLWHAPPLFSAALHNDFVHEVEHLSFLFSAMAFCWILLRPMGRRRITRGAGILYLFTTSAHGSLLGVLITFAPRPWYAHYVDTAPEWGLSPLLDQQLAGVLMWIPVGMVYAGLAAILLVLWMKDLETKIDRTERHSNTRRSTPPTYPNEER